MFQGALLYIPDLTNLKRILKVQPLPILNIFGKHAIVFLCAVIFCRADHVSADSKVKFLENKGQWHSKVQYRADLPGGRLFVENTTLSYNFLSQAGYQHNHDSKFPKDSIRGHAVKLNFLGANQNTYISSENKQTEYYNFFIGDDRSQWASHVNAYTKLTFNRLYKGVDLELLSQGNQLKYNFEIKPGQEPGQIRMHYQGASNVIIREEKLHIRTSVNSWQELKPFAYQLFEGKQKSVPCNYQMKGDQIVGFEFPEGYDTSRKIVIDPKVIFSTYSGSSSDNFGYTATFDTLGHAYSGGTVFGPNFPVTTGAYQTVFSGGADTSFGGSGAERDIGILKYNQSGTNVEYVTYLGGSHNEDPHSMVVNSEGDLLIFGNTGSSDFPVPNLTYKDTIDGDYDIFLAKLSKDGAQLKEGTYVGGTGWDGLNGSQQIITNTSPLGWNYGDMFRGEVIVDNQDRVYVASVTKSQDFPVSANAVQTNFGGGTQDGVAFVFNDDLTSLLHATYLGGNNDDAAYGLALDDQNNVFITGGTSSNQINFPLTGYQTAYNGDPADGFVCKLSNDLSTLQASTLLGTSDYDQNYLVDLDFKGDLYVTGQTSSDSFPVKNVNHYADSAKQYITKFDPNLDSIIFSSTIGSGNRPNPDLSPTAFQVDNCGKIYFSGWGGATNFKGNTLGLEVTNDAFQKTTDGSDFYIAVYAPGMDTLLYATYYGGLLSQEHVDGGTSRFDKNALIYQSICAGCGGNSDLPTTPNAHSRTNNSSNCNNALIKIDLNVPDLYSEFKIPQTSCVSDTLQFSNQSTLAKSYFWDFGDGDTAQGKTQAHSYDDTGTYNVRLIAFNPESCDIYDTSYRDVTIYEDVGADFSYDSLSCINSFQFNYEGNYGRSFKWKFGDAAISRKESPIYSFKDTGVHHVTLIVDSGTACVDTIVKQISINNLPRPAFSYNTDTCGSNITFYNEAGFTQQADWKFGDGTNLRTSNDTVTHQYNTSGTFQVTLITNPEKPCRDSISKMINLTTPDARFSKERLDSCQFKVRFVDTSKFAQQNSWTINGVDTFQNQDSVAFNFKNPGTYNVELVVKRFNPVCFDTLIQQITLDTLPRAAFQINRPTCSPEADIKADNQGGYPLHWNVQASDKSMDSSFFKQEDFTFLIPKNRIQYDITLRSDPLSPCADTASKNVFLDSSAYARFDYEIDTCEWFLQFDNQSVQPSQQTWDFGDGFQSNSKNPDHQYSNQADYQVKLEVQDQGCVDTYFDTISLPAIPRADFDLNQLACKPKLNINNQSQTATNYEWDLPYGAKGKFAADSIITLQDTSAFTITLNANPNGKCPDSSKKQFKPKVFASADFNLQRDPCSTSVSFKPDFPYSSEFNWHFGDGTTASSIEPEHQYSSNGQYQVQLNVKRGKCTDTVSQPLEFFLPKAGFDYIQEDCSPKVQFNNQSLYQDTSLWALGTGDSITLNSPEHTYQDSGQYQVTLIAKNDTGCMDVQDTTIQIPPFVNAKIDQNIDRCTGKAEFTDKSKRTTYRQWSIGNKTFDVDQVNYQFDSAGVYNIGFTTGNQECQDQLSDSIQIFEKPDASFAYKRDRCSNVVDFESIDSSELKHQWIFGDSRESDEVNPRHIYYLTRDYNVTHVVKNQYDCKDTVEQNVSVTNDFDKELQIPNVITPNGDGKNDYFTVKGLNPCKEYEVKVMNRWGQELYYISGQNIEVKWDGTTDGRDLSEGTYYYLINDKEGDLTREGVVHLIR